MAMFLLLVLRIWSVWHHIIEIYLFTRLSSAIQARQIFDKWFRQINEAHTNEDIVLLDYNVSHCMFPLRI